MSIGIGIVSVSYSTYQVVNGDITENEHYTNVALATLNLIPGNAGKVINLSVARPVGVTTTILGVTGGFAPYEVNKINNKPTGSASTVMNPSFVSGTAGK